MWLDAQNRHEFPEILLALTGDGQWTEPETLADRIGAHTSDGGLLERESITEHQAGDGLRLLQRTARSQARPPGRGLSSLGNPRPG
jgi:hypothetical protein